MLGENAASSIKKASIVPNKEPHNTTAAEMPLACKRMDAIKNKVLVS